jgi:hypothetical protein
VLGWLPVLLLLLSVVDGSCGSWSGRSGDVVDFSALPFHGDAPWRIKEELGRSGPLVSVLDLLSSSSSVPPSSSLAPTMVFLAEF